MYEVVLVESRVTVGMSSSLKNGARSHIEMLSAYTPFYIGIRNLRFKGRTVGPVDQLKHMCIPTCTWHLNMRKLHGQHKTTGACLIRPGLCRDSRCIVCHCPIRARRECE